MTQDEIKTFEAIWAKIWKFIYKIIKKFDIDLDIDDPYPEDDED